MEKHFQEVAMKRLVQLIFIFVLLMLTSCSNSSDSSSSPHPTSTNLIKQNVSSTCPLLAEAHLAKVAPIAPVTLNVMGWSSTTAEDNLMRSLLADFEQLHPSIKLNWISVNSHYEDTMSVLNAKGEMPDVFFMAPDMASSYISHQILLNLSPYMQRDHIAVSSYFPVLFTPFICDHTVYGIPKDWNTLGIVYNKTLFRQAGLPFPDGTWTWNKLRSTALKLTHLSNKGSSQYGISLPDNSSRWLAFLFANGGSVLDAKQKSATFTTPKAVDSLSFYTAMQLQDHSSILPGTLGQSWAGPVFGEQRAAMAIEGGWLIPYLAENYPHVDYGIAPLPRGPHNKQGNLLFTNAWAASATTKSPEASWEFIEYMTSATVQIRVLHSGLALPSLADIANDPSIARTPNIKTLFDALPYSTLDYYGPQDNFIHNRLDIAIQNVLLNNMSTQEALNTAAQQVNQALSSP
jgi:multiple sugar transport system substrate-binding protein